MSWVTAARKTARPLQLSAVWLAFASPSQAQTDQAQTVHAQTDPASAQSSSNAPDRLPAHGSAFGALRPDARAKRPGITVTTQRYAFTQSETATLMEGLREAAARAGIPKLGRTEWNVRWRYDYKRRFGRCSVGQVTTTLTVNYTLPDWQPATMPAPALRTRFDGFTDALDVHEYGHALIGFRAKQAIQRALSDASLSNSDCDRVGERLNAIANGLIDRARVEGDAYDAATGHGRSQGAYLSLKGL